MKRMLLVPAVIALCAGPAAAQTDLEGLVNVNIQDVLQDIAVDLNVEENNIPVTLQVPVSVAANVCDVDVSVLSAQLDTGEATCAAVTGSQELTQIVQQEMNAGGTDDTTAGTEEGTADDDTTAGTDEGTVEDDTTAGTDEGTVEDDTTAGTDDEMIDDDATAGTDDEIIEDDTTAGADDEATDETTTSSTKSAREFAPGQQDQPANEVAPGQQADPRAAAPGQVKKCPAGDPACE